MRHKENDESRIFTEEDGFQIAIAVVDPRTRTGEDFQGRELEEYIEVHATQHNFKYVSTNP